MIVTWVPGSSTVASLEAPRQSSPSTFTRPGSPGAMRSVTVPVLPSSASTPVRSSEPGPQPRHADDAGSGERNALRYESEAGDQPHHARYGRPHRQAGEPKARREHLSHEQRDGQQKPKQPIFHRVKAATLALIALSNLSQLLVEPL